VVGDVIEGAEWAWSKQGLAGAPQNPHATGSARDDVFDERGFADASLATYHCDAPLTADTRVQQRSERRHLLVAFEQTSRHTSPPRPDMIMRPVMWSL
jgi:hypothetical protein